MWRCYLSLKPDTCKQGAMCSHATLKITKTARKTCFRNMTSPNSILKYQDIQNVHSKHQIHGKHFTGRQKDEK